MASWISGISIGYFKDTNTVQLPHEPLDRFASNFDWGTRGMFSPWFNMFKSSEYFRKSLVSRQSFQVSKFIMQIYKVTLN